MSVRLAAVLVACCLGLGVGLAAGSAGAQGISALQDNEAPLEIDAEDGIEWQRDNKVYIARGNARAAQGDVEIYADTLTAYYREGANGSSEIYQVDAEGNVKIVSPDETAYGDHARYIVDTGVFTLTGEDIRMVAQQDTITARDSLEYYERDRYAVARGDAVATREDKRIRADLMIAHFEEDDAGKLEIQRVDAEGNVQISSTTDYASGDRAVYYVPREFATLAGSVKITREENQLNGEYAEIDLKSGVSRLLGAPPGDLADGGGRVRGLIIPSQRPGQEAVGSPLEEATQ